ncbi:MAG: 3-dehydroquinate synthase [Chloroflexota bacterium]
MTKLNNQQLNVTHPNGAYQIHIGRQLLPQVAAIAQIKGPFVVITDETVAPLHAQKVAGATAVIQVPTGERYKTLDTIRFIYDELFKLGLDRKGTLVALGGGVVGDMVGFAAATFMRGINFVQCPTTVLSMVDASVGGKTGVDMPQGKNLVGAFKQPTAVLADIDTLQTLPHEEISSGFAEVIKHGLINDPSLFIHFEASDWQLPFDSPSELIPKLQSIIARAIQVKIDVVQEDPYEQGRRATLNLGHTFGHAIEQVTEFEVSHGEGVAMGLVAAANLSAKLGYCDVNLQQRIESVLQKVKLPTRIPKHLDPELLYEVMHKDKKTAVGKVRFILIRDVGDVFLEGGVPETILFESIRAVQA